MQIGNWTIALTRSASGYDATATHTSGDQLTVGSYASSREAMIAIQYLIQAQEIS